MSVNTLNVGPGAHLSYSDSGAPSTHLYSTIFAIHGSFFNKSIFRKLQRTALANGYRFVAISRRPFSGSTPFSADEVQLLTNHDTSPEQRASFVEERGHEFARFIDNFIQKFNLPPPSMDGTSGGSILLGWSIGSHFAAATIAYTVTLSSDARSRLASHLRCLVIHDTSPTIMGLTETSGNWSPFVDGTLSMETRSAQFAHWVSAYFDHGDYSGRNPDTLEHVLPSLDKPPSLYNMSPEERKEVMSLGEEAMLDAPYIFLCQPQVTATTLRTFASPETAALFPNLKVKFLAGDRNPSFAITAIWAVQDKLKRHEKGLDISYTFIHGANHFMHWDDSDGLFKYIID